MDKQNSEDQNVSMTVFGIEIGQNNFCKTPAEAFASRLYNFEQQKDFSNGNEDKLLKIEQEKEEFLENFKQELDENQSVEDFLKEASSYSQEQSDIMAKKSQDNSGEENPFSGKISKAIAERYDAVSQQIENMIEPAEDFGQEQ